MEQIQQLRRITIWGVGLIGGSLGLALKKSGFQGQRIGLGRNIGRLKNALAHDAVDVITTELSEGLQDTDLIVLCTPVALVPMLVQRIAESVDTQHHRIVLTDVGSTKSELVKTVETQLQEQRADALSFVGGHPMAGSHETGVGAAKATLFENATCILTPTENTDADALALIKNLWEFVGAVPHLLSPETHDLLMVPQATFHILSQVSSPIRWQMWKPKLVKRWTLQRPVFGILPVSLQVHPIYGPIFSLRIGMSSYR